MTKPTPHGQVPESLIDLIDTYAETRHRCGGIYNTKTEAARNAVIEALSGVQALSAAPAEQEEAAQRLRKTLDIDPGDVNDPLHPRYIAGFKSGHAAGRRRAAPAASPTPPAEQQAAPKAAPGVGNSGFDHKTAADLLNNKTVSDEAVRNFVATSRWAHDERAALSATLLAMHGVLTSREAEIALLKKALLEAEAAPQQEVQEPCGWTTGITWRPDTRLQSEQVIKITRDTQPKYGYTTPIYTAPQPAPAPLSDDTKRLDWMDKDAGERVIHVGADWYTRPTYGQPHRKHKNLRAAIDAALAAQGGKT